LIDLIPQLQLAVDVLTPEATKTYNEVMSKQPAKKE